MTWAEEKELHELRKIEIFKYMIQFLEIYGNENFGQSAEVNWSSVWNFCSKCDILDFNYEVEDLVYNTKEEDFRDKVFEFVEKQAIEGYPIWRLFTMTKWLQDKCEEELIQNEHKKDIEYFNNTKCYRCQYFSNKLRIVYSTLFDPVCSGDFDSVEDFKTRHPGAKVKTFNHEMCCKKREQLLADAWEKELNDQNAHYGKHFENEFKQDYEFEYSKFNYTDESQDDYSRDWVLYPLALKKCSYFIESDMTPEKFEKLWHEIPRRDNGN